MTIDLNDNLHDVNKPIIGKNPCRVCGKELVLGANWYKIHFKNHSYICINCTNKSDRQWYSNNKEKRKKTKKQYNETPIGKFRNVARRANRDCITRTTYKHLICLFVSANGLCPYTNRKLSFNDMHLEHINSKSSNGNNNYDNLIFVSDVYNFGKNGYTTQEYIERMGDLINKEQMLVAYKTIQLIHNRYEFMINDYLKKTDEELEFAVKSIIDNN